MFLYIAIGKDQETLLCQLFTSKYAVHWKRIGNLLDIDDDTLDKIANDFQNAEEECCNTLWKVWLDKNINASWNSVSLAIDIISVTTTLQDIYKNDRNKDREDALRLYQPKDFANVSMIRYNENLSTLKEVELIAKATHSGKINICPAEQSRYKRFNCVSDIFDTSEDMNLPSVSNNVILIEGMSGIGKTYISKEIVFQWACENLLCKKHFLFLIYLRDIQISQIKSLDDLVCYAIKSTTSKSKLVSITAEYLEVNLGKHCTILFDGYDEIAEDIKKDSLIAKIIRRDILPLCSLVITSRPSASIDLHSIANCRIEILGFTKDDQNEYIQKNLQDEEIEKMRDYLHKNPFINDLCYIPLNLTILLCLFKEISDSEITELPKTQTDINSQFIYITISRFISKQKKKIVIKSPKDLKMPYKQNFNVLCKLAFELLGKEKVVFNDDDMRQCVSKKSFANWNTLGLLREANYYSVQENANKKSYSYIHASMQECLAAHYIKKEAENIFLKKYFWDSRYLNTGIMYAGLTKGESSAFKSFFSENLGKFGRQLDAGKSNVSYGKVEKLHFFHCLLETKKDELTEQLKVDEILYDETIDLSDHALKQKDIHTLSFILTISTIKHWKKINLSHCNLNDEKLGIFSTFSISKVVNVSIDTIDLSNNNLSSCSSDAIVNLINCYKIKRTMITSDNIAESPEFKASLNIIVPKAADVMVSCGSESLFLINCKLDNSFLNLDSFTRHLYIWKTTDFESITNGIKNCDAINIYQENLSDSKIADIACELETVSTDQNKTVTYLLQSTNQIIAYGADFYQVSQSLRNPDFSKHYSGSSTPRKIVNISQCNIGDENIVKLNQIFKDYCIKHLDELDVSKCNLTSLSIPMLIEILKCCIIKDLIISNNSICKETFCDLILSEQSKLLNFKMNIPLKICTSDNNIIFFVNCEFNDLISSNICYDFVNSQLYFSNIKLQEKNIQSFLNLCKRNEVQINVFEMNMSDEIATDVSVQLKKFQSNAYLLASNTRLIACNAKDFQVMEAILNNSNITTLQLNSCEVYFSKMNPLGKLLTNTNSQNWKVVDFSECKIKDEGFLSLYECFIGKKKITHIEALDLSSNCLSQDSIIAILKIFEFCVIKTLMISRNDIPVYTFNKALRSHLFAKKHFSNFQKENLLPLSVYESDSSLEICNVYAFRTSNINLFVSPSFENDTLYNLYYVQLEQDHFFKSTFSVLITSSVIKVYVLVEGVMNERICDMMTELTNFTNQLSKVDFSSIPITYESCNILCSSLFNDKSSLNVIEVIDFSSQQFSLACAPTIIESLQYCTIKHLILPNIQALDKISETILRDFHGGKIINNFIERIPLTVNIENEVEEEDEITYNIVANTYLQNYEIKEELFSHYDDLVMNQITTSHTFVLLDCLKANTLNSILSILYTKATYIKICIFDIRLTVDMLEASINHLKTLKKEIYRNRLRYILASNSKIVAYNAKRFHILQALQIKPKICVLEIVHCLISKNYLKVIALALMGMLSSLKQIKIVACKIKDKELFEFCDILSHHPKASICLEVMDFSQNHLTSSCIGTIVRLLQCCVIEKLVLSRNSINDSALTDAIFQLARHQWNKICNSNLSKPLVIINAPTLQHCIKGKYVTLFYMNCKIDENLTEYYCKVRKIYCLNSSDLKMNMLQLHHPLPSDIKIYLYEKNLKDKVAHEAAVYLTKEIKAQINFILVSKTKLFANNSSYHQIAPLLDSNHLINVLQLTNFYMKLPRDSRFTKALLNCCRKWEVIDFSGCNIRDDGCLELQKCWVASRSTIKYLNFKHNNLTPISATCLATVILNCDTERINISGNKLQDTEINNVLGYVKQNSRSVSVEIIFNDNATIILSNTDTKLLPYQLLSSNCNTHLSLMECFTFDYIDCTLSSFNNAHLSMVTLKNNGLTLEQTESIIHKLPMISLHIAEAHMQYSSNFINYSIESLKNILFKVKKDDSNLFSFSSLTLIKLDQNNNKICMYNIKLSFNSVEDTLKKFISRKTCTTFVAIKLSNCYVTHTIATELAAFLNKTTEVKLFMLTDIQIQEQDLKLLFKAFQSTKSLLFFSIKSINSFIEDAAEDIANIIKKNNEIQYLEISNCSIKQSMFIKISKSIGELKQLKQLNLVDIPITSEALHFALNDKVRLNNLICLTAICKNQIL